MKAGATTGDVTPAEFDGWAAGEWIQLSKNRARPGGRAQTLFGFGGTARLGACQVHELSGEAAKASQGFGLAGAGRLQGVGVDLVQEQSQVAGNCRLAIGWTRERLVRELRRLVEQRVRVLHGLRESAAMQSEWDGPWPPDSGVSLFDGMAAESERENQQAREWRKAEFEAFLKGEPELAAIFGCLWAGMSKPAEIARRLGMEEAAVVRGRKRLDRRMAKVRQSGAPGDKRK